MMKKILSALLALAMILTLTVPAVAANDSEKKLTYNDRVQVLKKDYNVTYGAGIEANRFSAEDVNAALEATEYALHLLGSSAMKKIASPHIAKRGKFTIRYGAATVNEYGTYNFGIYNSGDVQFAVSNQQQFEKDVSGDSDYPMDYDAKHFMAYVILHEIGHAYDDDFLNYRGGNAIKGFKEKHNLSFNNLIAGGYIPKADDSPVEAFADIFAWMLTSNKPITDYSRYGDPMEKNYNKNDLAYKQCEIVYEFMLRDFGAGSAAVKRAAKFLEKELPKEK